MRSSTIYETDVVYNGLQRPVTTWGPAPVSLFQTNSPHPLATEVNNVPSTSTTYDGGFGGLMAAWYDDTAVSGVGTNRPAFVGAPKEHQLVAGPSRWEYTGAPVGGVGADHFSGRFTGLVYFASTGNYQFKGSTAGAGARMLIDGEVVVDSWNATGTWPTSAAKSYAAGWHRVVFELKAYTGTSVMHWEWLIPGGSWVQIPAGSFKPDLGLVTSQTGVDGVVTTTGYSDPVAGQVTASTVDPGGLNLTSATTHETRGTTNQFMRRVSRSLPAGASSTNTYAYYTGSEVPSAPTCAGSGVSVTAVAQRGLQKSSRAADPTVSGGSGGLLRQSIYDASGRVVAARVSTDAKWSCTQYDSRGRVSVQTFPGSAGTATSGVTVYGERTVSTNYAVGGDPLLSSVSDASGTVTTRVDLLGRVTDTKDALGVVTHTDYDVAGKVTRVSVFNASNQVLSRSAPIYSTTGVTANQVTQERMSFAAATVTGYNHTTLTATTSMPTPASWVTVATVNSDAAGRVSSVVYSNGVTATFGYDSWGRENQVTYTKPAGTIYTDQVTFDKTGRIVDRNNDGFDANTGGVNYTYDSADRLTSWVERDTASGWYNQGSYSFAYGAGVFTATCSGVVGANPDAGKNSNRVSQTRSVSGSTVTTTYCYDYADRLQKVAVSSGANPYSGGFIYDDHGNATTHGGNVLSFDGADRHMKTQAGSTSVEYVRDVADRIIGRKVNGTLQNQWAHTGAGDASDITLTAAGVLAEVTVSLPGGVLYTYKPSMAGVWSLMNIHGDTASVVNEGADGVFPTLTYDPFGQTFSYTAPDNTAGDFDYGWHGEAQRRIEYQTGLLPLIQMGARPFDPALDRFLEVDPIQGGCSNDYAHPNNPITDSDLSGLACPTSLWDTAKLFGYGDLARGAHGLTKDPVAGARILSQATGILFAYNKLEKRFLQSAFAEAIRLGSRGGSIVIKAIPYIGLVATFIDGICAGLAAESKNKYQPPGPNTSHKSSYNPSTQTSTYPSGSSSSPYVDTAGVPVRPYSG
ncbi:MAG: PA14 domain-containing protein [Microthrixaceae bacterium]|nr:PA14 domain-containing protein [Microthrixaceae bacterium]